MNENLNNEI